MTMDQLDGIAPIHENWGCNLGEELDDGGDPLGFGPRTQSIYTAYTRYIYIYIADIYGVYAKPELKTLIYIYRIYIYIYHRRVGYVWDISSRYRPSWTYIYIYFIDDI